MRNARRLSGNALHFGVKSLRAAGWRVKICSRCHIHETNYHSLLNAGNENNRLRENSAGQITIQCSEGSPATGQHPKNDFFHGIGEDMIDSAPPVE
jgi:hypothetical protein